MTTIGDSVISFTADKKASAGQEAQENHHKHLPPQGMSRASQLLPFVPFSKTTLFTWSKDGRFPAPIKLSPTMTAWRNSEVIEWLAKHSASKQGA